MKAGIITFYYHNDNYGGLLQSAALVEALGKMGIDALQIAFDRSTSPRPFPPERQGGLLAAALRKAAKTVRRLPERALIREAEAGIARRKGAMRRFAEGIPHTAVMTESSLPSLQKDFDVFICGSDQIWNPSYTRNAYFLDFAGDRKKVAYAASVGRVDLTPDEFFWMRPLLQDFAGVSVREERAAELLKFLVSSKIRTVVDPTLLLDRADWEKMIASRRGAAPAGAEAESGGAPAREPAGGDAAGRAAAGRTVVRAAEVPDGCYIGYFLGNNPGTRAAALKAAAKAGRKLVTFPHILGAYRRDDVSFGDLQVYDCDPLEFVDLIRRSDGVLTDSFHACVFSILFGRPFAVFDRESAWIKKAMISRISSLLVLFGLTGHRADESFEGPLPETPPIGGGAFAERRAMSEAFLREMLL